MAGGKIQVSTYLDSEQVEILDSEAKELNLTRSAYVGFIIANRGA